MTAQNTKPQIDPLETQKRRRERILTGFLGFVFLIFTVILFKLFGMSEQLPLQHSIFFFGLVNFNIILFLLLMFMIFRNVVKNFAEREGGPIGSSLKSKLIAAFVGFSFVPTALMFVVSVFYINNSFDRWFNERISSVLKSSIEVTNTYYLSAKRRNYHFANLVAKDLANVSTQDDIKKILNRSVEKYSLDSVEFYPDLFGDRTVSIKKGNSLNDVPAVSLEIREKGIESGSEWSTVHHFAEGDLIRVIVPTPSNAPSGAVVVSSYIPLSLVSKMDDIASTLENFKDTDPLTYPIKSIYLIILVLMTLVILLCATWFGFYLARQLSIPLEELAHASQKVVRGEYQAVQITSGSPEINRLIADFNTMTEYLGRSEKEIQEANSSLRKMLSRLDEHNRYMEVVLSQVTTGVVSVDVSGVLTMINRHAARLLNVDADAIVGKKVSDVLGRDYLHLFLDLLRTMRDHDAETLHKEIQISVKGRPVLLSMTISVLKDEKGQEIGKILVFDDLTPMLAAQRASAWTEVARRIAHEIKNPLTPISLAAQRLQRKFGDQITDPAFSDCTTMIVDQVDGLKRLVNEFSQFARMPKAKPVLGNLNQTIADSLQLFVQGSKQVKIHFEPDPKLPEFLFDTDSIQRALTNLVDNAVESVKVIPDGAVQVETAYDSQSRVVRLTVADNGTGIPANIRDRIFEPYMTTKRHGTGLGLAIVKRTVEDHNGYVRVLENQPHGTRFVIELPVVLSNTAEQVVKPELLEKSVSKVETESSIPEGDLS